MGEGLELYEAWKAAPGPGPRAPLPAQEMLKIAGEMVLHGEKPMAIARKLSIPYPHAEKLVRSLQQGVVSHIESRYDPETRSALKDELLDVLVEEVQDCREAVRKSFEEGTPNTRHFTPLNTAIKHINAMAGFNAPTQSVTIEWKANAMVSPEVQARVMQDPRAREALMVLEEIRSQQQAGYPAAEAEGGDA